MYAESKPSMMKDNGFLHYSQILRNSIAGITFIHLNRESRNERINGTIDKKQKK